MQHSASQQTVPYIGTFDQDTLICINTELSTEIPLKRFEKQHLINELIAGQCHKIWDTLQGICSRNYEEMRKQDQDSGIK